MACQHHGERVIIRPIYFGGVQLTLRRCQHQIKRLRTKTHHQHLALGIAKSDVIFHKPGLPVFDHQPCIKHALIRYTAPAHFGHRGADNLMQCFLSNLLCQHRRWRVGPHAAGIRAAIAIAHALVILRAAHRQHSLAIAEHKKRGFLSFHELFNHDFCACAAKFAREHVIHGGIGCLDIFGDNHAFARGQAIGLYHDWCPLRGDIGFRALRIAKMPIGCGWRFGGITNLFGEVFA